MNWKQEYIRENETKSCFKTKIIKLTNLLLELTKGIESEREETHITTMRNKPRHKAMDSVDIKKVIHVNVTT